MKSTTDSLPAAETDDRSPDHVFARLVLEAESRAIGVAIRELGPGFDAVVERLVALKGAVIVSGSGKSGLVGRKISATLASTGTPSHFLHPSDAMHGDLGRIQPTDALLLLSFGGETEDTLALAALVRQDGLPVISMTGKPESHLARISDFHLCIGRVTEVDTHTLAPTASTTVMMAMGDALALALARRRSFTPADFHKRHPGGQLGRMMMPVSNVLRFKVGQNLPLVADELSVGQVLKRAAEQGGIGEGSARPRPVGAVLLIDTDGRLSGIFTDADLRRRLVELGPAVLDQPIAQVMTRQPRTLSNDATVRDAVQLVRETRLDELPVVDAQGKPVGLIDVQDLVALKVIEATSK
ncbi:MAG: KpsF/GutQ family sugar-phosphate isomerase [Phycisphaeraceae bacterium]|nr:KpsF/GutQ family sugar-phosphate isomerase [Phycisphaeraceae bacterium]